ncbi:MAG: SIS domain-containing protein [Anaerolineales bacterium]
MDKETLSSLQNALANFDAGRVEPLAKTLRNGGFDRILLTGMGASLQAAYPAWLTLAHAGLPAWWVDTAELIHYAPKLVTSRTLYWVFSHSGRSAEIVSALDFGRLPRPAALLATVNDLESPLAKAAMAFDGPAAVIPIQAAAEQTVSTRTDVNSLALGQLTATLLAGEDASAVHSALQETAMAMQTYLDEWEAHLQRIGELLGFPKRLVLLGRGWSLATTYTGALVLGEAAKYAAIPLQAGEFRHGPLELANADLSALVFGGAPETRHLNARLLEDLRSHDVAAFWIGSEPQTWQIEIPEVPVWGIPLVEILPMRCSASIWHDELAWNQDNSSTLGK